MIITLNYEAPGKSTVELTGMLHNLFASPVTRTRVQDSSYRNSDGLPVHVKTIISKINTPLNDECVREAVFALACQLGQDCIAIRYVAMGGAVNALIGPRADKWLPFNPAYFVEY